YIFRDHHELPVPSLHQQLFDLRCLGRELGFGVHQCRKCRSPVKTIARLALSAALMTSSSRTEPPGWITAVAPASTAAIKPSANGKKASDDTTLPLVSGSLNPAALAASPAFQAAMRAESTRLICPAPTPTVASFFT